MSYSTQSPYRVHRISGSLPQPESYFRRLRAALAAFRRSLAEHSRTRRDERQLMEMTDHQLRDIGLRRVSGHRVMQIVQADDWQASSD